MKLPLQSIQHDHCSSGYGVVYVNWNDDHTSQRQHEVNRLCVNSQHILSLQASQLMLRKSTVQVVNDRINCQVEWIFGARRQLTPLDQQRIYDLSDPKTEFFLLFARGPADPHSARSKSVPIPVEMSCSTRRSSTRTR